MLQQTAGRLIRGRPVPIVMAAEGPPSTPFADTSTARRGWPACAGHDDEGAPSTCLNLPAVCCSTYGVCPGHPRFDGGSEWPGLTPGHDRKDDRTAGPSITTPVDASPMPAGLSSMPMALLPAMTVRQRSTATPAGMPACRTCTVMPCAGLAGGDATKARD